MSPHPEGGEEVADQLGLKKDVGHGPTANDEPATTFRPVPLLLNPPLPPPMSSKVEWREGDGSAESPETTEHLTAPTACDLQTLLASPDSSPREFQGFGVRARTSPITPSASRSYLFKEHPVCALSRLGPCTGSPQPGMPPLKVPSVMQGTSRTVSSP